MSVPIQHYLHLQWVLWAHSWILIKLSIRGTWTGSQIKNPKWRVIEQSICLYVVPWCLKYFIKISFNKWGVKRFVIMARVTWAIFFSLKILIYFEIAIFEHKIGWCEWNDGLRGNQKLFRNFHRARHKSLLCQFRVFFLLGSGTQIYYPVAKQVLSKKKCSTVYQYEHSMSFFWFVYLFFKFCIQSSL